MQFKTYREVCRGVTDRGTVLPIGYDFVEYWDMTDCYYSLYGYMGPTSNISKSKDRVIDHLVVDLDTQDLDIVKSVVERCEQHGIEYRLYFSGTGFHVVIPNIWQFESADIYNKTVQHTMTHYFPEGDPTVYDARRIIRMPGTKNSKSGLFKVELSVHILDKSIEYIHEYAKERHIPDCHLPTEVGDAFDSWTKIHSIGKPLIASYMVDHSIPSPKCIHKLLRTIPIEGQRHQTCMRIASHLLHYVGLPVDSTIAVLNEWWGNNPDDLTHLVQGVKEKYRYGCKDPMLAANCHSNCAYFREKDYMGFGVSLTDTHVSYLDKIKRGEYWDLKQYYPEIESPFTIMNNDLLGIIGTQGAGKSTMYIDMVLKLGLNVVISNIDMADDMLVRKFVQHELKLSKDDIFKGKKYDEQLKVTRGLENRITVTPVSSLDEVDKILRNHQQFGLATKPDAWVFDHVGNITMQNISGYERMRELGRGLKRLATQHDILVIAVGHVTRENSRNNQLDINSARDANLGESSDVMIGVTREGLRWVKNRPVYSSNNVNIFSVKYRDNDPFLFERILNVDFCTFDQINDPRQRKLVFDEV